MGSKRIVIYGNFAVDYTSESHHASSLEALGNKVIRLQENEVTSNEVLRQALNSDLLIWIHSHGFVNRGSMPMINVINELRLKGIKTIAYHLDLYMGIERWNEYKNDIYIKELDYFFTVDKKMSDYLNNNTKTKGYYIPAGVFHEETYSLNLPKVNDVIFVGSYHYHKEWQYRPLLIDNLRNKYKDRFKLYGSHGEGVYRGIDLNRLYGQTKVVVGDTLSPNFDYPYYYSDRLFETIGRGGFIIFPEIEGIRELFSKDELVTYTYNDFEELYYLIDYFIKNDEKRKKIKEKAFEKVKLFHTYYERWKEILKIVFKE